MSRRDGAAAPSRSPGRRISELLPLFLALVAEGAWLAVLAGLLHEYAKRPPGIGIVEMALLAGVGALGARLAAVRLGDAWPYLAVVLVVAGSLAGVLYSPAARDMVATEGIAALGRAIGANPGGLLGGLAVLRGAGYVGRSPSEDRLEQLLLGGTLAIVVAAVVGGIVPDPWRGRFVADALVAAVVFAAAAIVALALRRQALEGRDRGADWQRNPRWVALLVVVVLVISALAALTAGLVRPTLEVLVALLVMPLIVLGLIFGWTRRGLIQGLAFGLVGVIVALLFNVFAGRLDLIPELPDPDIPAGPEQTPLEPSVVAFGGGVVVVLAVLAAFLLARWWARRLAGEPGDPTEERFIDRPPPASPRRVRRRGWLGRRSRPADAAAAYLALLADLERDDDVRREPWETPREHAARLRSYRTGGLSLELLAADYQLLAFGGRALSEPERQRAIERWRRLRRSVKAPELPRDANP